MPIEKDSAVAPASVNLLVVIPFPPHELARLQAAFAVTYAPTPEARAAAIAAGGGTFKAVLTHGTAGFTAAEIAALPQLELISCYGVGYENIDVGAALARGIVVTHGPGTNTVSVADHALALMLSLIRGIPQADRAVRAGAWHDARRSLPQMTDMRLGVVGLGAIGREIARRCHDGFRMSVAYHNRHRLTDVAFTHHPSLISLAAASDVLVLAAPGGAETRHMVDAEVLEVLGPKGYLVNIARGSLIDTDALVAALAAGRIAGAALDVVEGEPRVPAALLAAPNLVITPHSAGRSPASEAAMTLLALENLTAHFAGYPVVTPVPECVRAA